MSKTKMKTLALALALLPSCGAARSEPPRGAKLLTLVAEAPPMARGCIPGPHEPGRTRRQVGQAVSSAWVGANQRSVDQYPHCGGDEGGDLDALAR